MLLCWKHVCHSSANCTLRQFGDVANRVIRSLHTKQAQLFPFRCRIEMRRCIIRHNRTPFTASIWSNKLRYKLQRIQVSSSTNAWWWPAVSHSGCSRDRNIWPVYASILLETSSWESTIKSHGLHRIHIERRVSRDTGGTSGATSFAWK